jgi:hypothetical protein
MSEEWRLSKTTGAGGLRWRIDDGETCIAVVYTEADARMMAAAPKMAKALMAARQFIFDTFGTNTGLANAVVQGNGIDAALDAAVVKHE